jgi:hypothetical protein
VSPLITLLLASKICWGDMWAASIPEALGEGAAADGAGLAALPDDDPLLDPLHAVTAVTRATHSTAERTSRWENM